MTDATAIATAALAAIHTAWAWLGAFRYGEIPYAQAGAVLLVSLGVPWLLRTYFAEQWQSVVVRATEGARPWLGDALTVAFYKAIQAVPSICTATALAVLTEGGDVAAIIKWQLLSLFTPLIHEAGRKVSAKASEAVPGLPQYYGGRYPAAGAAPHPGGAS